MFPYNYSIHIFNVFYLYSLLNTPKYAMKPDANIISPNIYFNLYSYKIDDLLHLSLSPPNPSINLHARYNFISHSLISLSNYYY